jgi:hypothetical protein
MKILLPWLALVLEVLAVHGQSAISKPLQAPFTLTISVADAVVKAGTPVQVKVRMTNISDHDVNVSGSYDGPVNISYRYDVRDSAGRPAKSRQHNNPISGHSRIRTLKPGESTEDMTLVTEEFDMANPGVYVIQLSRPATDNPKEGVVKSNKLEVTVTP